VAADRRPVVVLAALREEAQDLARHLVQARIEGPGVRSWEGTLAGKPVVLVLTRVGEGRGGDGREFAWDVHRPHALVSIGLAGAADGGSARGRLIVASGASSTTWMQGRSPMREA
jgi:nucleoside phosphorylase